MRRFLTAFLLSAVLCMALLPLVAFATPLGAPPGFPFPMDPTIIVSTVLVYALTVAAKALGLPDATAPVRAFAALVALLIPIVIAWHSGALATYDWNSALPLLWTAGQALTNAVTVYLAAGGLNTHVKDALNTKT